MSASENDCEKAFEFPDWKKHLTHNNSEAVLKLQLAAQSALLRKAKEVLELIDEHGLDKIIRLLVKDTVIEIREAGV